MDIVHRKICDIIDLNREKIIAFGRDMRCHAELAYKEYRTSANFAKALEDLGIPTETGLAVTGVKGQIRCSEGPDIAIIGELDGLPIPDNSLSWSETGASHTCGHDAQLAAVYGAAIALSCEDVRKTLTGTVSIFGAPAEECGDVSEVVRLREDGKDLFIGGKCQLVKEGAFDGVEIAVAHHAVTDAEIRRRTRTGTGFVTKKVRYSGRAAHAAGAPHLGIDAQNAALLALHAVDLNRESFKDEDHVRVHSFMPKTGKASNVVADDVELEFSIRAGNHTAILDASKKIDRACRAGAVGTGCGMSLETFPGYLPLKPMTSGTDPLDEAMLAVADGRYRVNMQSPTPFGAGSTDHGDLSHLMPLMFFETGGFTGVAHDKSLEVSDEELAYIVPAKIFALTAYNLLKNGASEAKRLIIANPPLMTKEEYLATKQQMASKADLPVSEL